MDIKKIKKVFWSVLIVFLVIFLLTKACHAAALPSDFTAGNKLTAAELNQWKNQRESDVKPISSTTNDYIDATFSLGSSSYRWLNGNFSGVIRADGQYRVEMIPSTNQLLGTGSNLTTFNFATAVYQVGTGYVAGNQYYTIPETGYYYISLHVYASEASSATGQYILYKNSLSSANLLDFIYFPSTGGALTYRYETNGVYFLTINDKIYATGASNGGGTHTLLYQFTDYNGNTTAGTRLTIFKVF